MWRLVIFLLNQNHDVWEYWKGRKLGRAESWIRRYLTVSVMFAKCVPKDDSIHIMSTDCVAAGWNEISFIFSHLESQSLGTENVMNREIKKLHKHYFILILEQLCVNLQDLQRGQTYLLFENENLSLFFLFLFLLWRIF